MYGKVFASMYDGTLAGNWQAIVTLQQMIVLCDMDGVLDMTPQALSARTSIPLDIIQAGIEHLEKPDPYSRTQDSDGRRIERLDAHRAWGWRLVNYTKYRHLKDAETVRAQNRERQQHHRAASQAVTSGHALSQTVTTGNAPKRQVEVEVEVEVEVNKKTLSGKQPDPAPLNGKRNYKTEAAEVLEFLNKTTGRNYRQVEATLHPIVVRLKSGVTVQDCRTVIIRKWRDWHRDEKMEKYLRPKTLFAASNFENYLGECVAK